jgi:hypothetical protein
MKCPVYADLCWYVHLEETLWQPLGGIELRWKIPEVDACGTSQLLCRRFHWMRDDKKNL